MILKRKRKVITFILLALLFTGTLVYAAQGSVYNQASISSSLDLLNKTYTVTGSSQTWESLAQASYVEEISAQVILSKDYVVVSDWKSVKFHNTYTDITTSDQYSGSQVIYRVDTRGYAKYSDGSSSVDYDGVSKYVGSNPI